MPDDQGSGGTPKTYTEDEVAQLTAGLKRNNQELLAEKGKLQDRLKPWEGKDPEQVSKVLEEHDRLTAEQQKAKGDWAAREATLRNEFKAEHDKVLTPLQQENGQLRERLFDAVAIREATEAIAAAEGSTKLLLPILRPELTTVEVDGRLVTAVKGPDGKPRYHSTTGVLVTPAERIAELKALPDYAPAFKGAPGSGSGGRGGQGGGAKSYTKLSDFTTDAEKVQFIAEHGREAFEKLAFASAPAVPGGKAG